MASSKLISNQDPPRQPRSSTLQTNNNQPHAVTMEELFKDIYAPPPDPKSVDEVWKEIVAGGQQRMTLEDFLTKAGAATEVNGLPGAVDSTTINGAAQFPGFGNNGLPPAAGGGGGGGRGKRRAVEEPPMDKASQQKQKRMIKNRESAARSRERKQAYTIELETLVTQLEEENAQLRKEEAESKNSRLKQLMENLIPVEEKRRSPRGRPRRLENGYCTGNESMIRRGTLIKLPSEKQVLGRILKLSRASQFTRVLRRAQNGAN